LKIENLEPASKIQEKHHYRKRWNIEDKNLKHNVKELTNEALSKKHKGRKQNQSDRG